MKYDDSFFGKIKNFFKILFRKEKQQEIVNNPIEEKIEIQQNNEKEKFHNSLKAEVNNDYANEIKRERILDSIEKEPNKLYNLSIEKLKKIEELFIESIKKQEEKLTK